MIPRLFLAALLAALPMLAYTQETVGEPDTADVKASVPDPTDTAADKRISQAAADDPGPIVPAKLSAEVPKVPIEYRYVRPNAERRFKNYLNNVAGPVSLIYYSTTAGLLTLRNSPKEWGDKPDGAVRRLGNVVAKHAIMATTTYALDEALKLDSTFYRSRDRSLAGRLRNCVFSAVTARNRKGKRVPGIPVMAGGVVSGVIASSGWYPNRYDYVHGLKGGAISLGVTAGINLIKEFVWNPGGR